MRIKFLLAVATGVMVLSACDDGPALKKADFTKNIGGYRVEYKDKSQKNANEAALSLIRISRRKYLEEMPKTFVDWQVVRSSLSTDSDRVAHIAFTLSGKNDSLGRIFGNDSITLWADIDPDDPLYTAISLTNDGQILKISGRFIVDDEDDYVSERSLTEDGSVTSPEFEIKINSIKY